jgi:hypothetical protein
MDTCSQCNTELSRDTLFCPACGKPVPGREDDELLASSASDPTGLLDRLRAATAGEFKIIRELGRGGMGRVYLAQQIALDRRVALKVLPPALSEHAQVVERFQREARTAGGLNHPNIVGVYQVSERDGLHFFTMPYVAGPSLRQVLAQTPQLEIGLCRRYLREAADALAYAHGRDVIHRDIKPENMLLEGSRDGRLLLTDFGIAKALGAATTLTRPGDMMGTPYFMSPEQCGEADHIDGRADQYSLGLVGYEMLAGRFPFTADSLAGLVYKHLHEYPEPLDQVRADVPEDLRAAIERAIRKSPDERFPDMDAMLRALGTRPGQRTAKPAAQPATRRRRGPARWGRWAALISVAGLAAAAGSFAIRYGSGERDGGPTLEEISLPATNDGRPQPVGAGVLDSAQTSGQAEGAADPGVLPAVVPAGQPPAEGRDERSEDRAQAERARREAEQARAAARAAGADTIFGLAFAQADSLLAGGQSDLGNGRLITAAMIFATVKEDFELLERQAERRLQELQDAAAAAADEATAGQDSLGAVGPGEQPAEPPPVTPREAIAALLERYRQSLEAADLVGLARDVYRGTVPEADAELYNYWFSNADNISVSIDLLNEDIRDDDARLQVRLSMSYELRRTGDRRRTDQSLEMLFERTAAGWRLLRAER